MIVSVALAAGLVAFGDGPARITAAAILLVVQVLSTWIVRRHARDLHTLLGAYLFVETVLGMVVALLQPSLHVPAVIVMVAALSVDAGYLTRTWSWPAGAMIVLDALVPALRHDTPHGTAIVVTTVIMVGHALVNRSGTVIRAETAADEARFTAEHDDLTRLPNRRRLVSQLRRATGQPVGLLLIDMDSFKEVNDTLGHTVGDAVLRAAAARLRAVCRGRHPSESPLVARLGGDEFAVLAVGGTARLERFARSIAAAFEEPLDVHGSRIVTRFSIGMAHSAQVPVDELLRFADIAMYRAKRERSGPCWYRSEDDPHSHRRLSLLQDLPGAIVAGAIEPRYQPIVDAETGEVRTLEALVRWNHPDHGLVGAAELLELVTLSGLQVELTVAVLDTALQQLTTWPDDISLSANITVRDLRHAEFLTALDGLVEHHGVDRRRLVLELVEDEIVPFDDRCAEALVAIRRSGVRIALDDFGRASSSLWRLGAIDIDTLKIDRWFVSRMLTYERAAEIVHAVVALAAGTGADVIAEGVETTEVLDAVRGAGVRLAQGYLFAHPLLATEVGPFLAEATTSDVSTPVGVPAAGA